MAISNIHIYNILVLLCVIFLFVTPSAPRHISAFLLFTHLRNMFSVFCMCAMPSMCGAPYRTLYGSDDPTSRETKLTHETKRKRKKNRKQVRPPSIIIITLLSDNLMNDPRINL